MSRRHTRKHARDFLDYDYVDKLSEKDRAWLEKFSREFYQINFTNTRKDKHARQADRRRCYNDDNARRRDMWNNLLRAPFDLADILVEDEDE